MVGLLIFGGIASYFSIFQLISMLRSSHKIENNNLTVKFKKVESTRKLTKYVITNGMYIYFCDTEEEKKYLITSPHKRQNLEAKKIVCLQYIYVTDLENDLTSKGYSKKEEGQFTILKN